MGYKKVMIVDDADIDRHMAEKVMIKYNFAGDVVSVESAMDALEFIKERETDPQSLPNLIFLDINMPEMSGFDFLDEYSKFPALVKKKCIIVMLSSSLLPEDKERAMRSPYVCKFISKPLSADKLEDLRDL